MNPYYRARYYEPSSGTFISDDPIRFGGGIDFYRYVRNNPVNFDDPSGEKIGWQGDVNDIQMAFLYLHNSPTAAALIAELEQAPETYIINASDLNSEDTAPGSQVYWNPHLALCVKKGAQSPAVALAHELVHLRQHKHKLPAYGFDPKGNFVDLLEEPATAVQSQIAIELGEAPRQGYYDAGKNFTVAVPIMNKSGNSCQCGK